MKSYRSVSFSPISCSPTFWLPVPLTFLKSPFSEWWKLDDISAYTAHSPKHFPWFVSDVTPTDFYKTIDSLLSPTFFLADSAVTSESVQHLKQLVERWQRYLKEGIFCLSTELEDGHKKTQFWTGPWPYWCMEEKANELHQWLAGSSLVIFKV